MVVMVVVFLVVAEEEIGNGFFFGWVFLVESIYIILMTSKNKYQDVECIIKWYDTIDNVTF